MPGISVKVDIGGVKKKLSPKSFDKGKYSLMNQVHSDMNQFVPKLQGDLRMQSNVTSDNSSIVYSAPYARRMFYMKFVNYTTPGTGARWDLKAKSLFISSWIKAFKGGAGL